MERRVIVVGDVHGCLDEFDELLRVVSYDRAWDRLILAGDLVDRGPDSIGVIRRARELGAESVKGNHECWYSRYRIRREQFRLGQIERILMKATPPKTELFDRLSDDDWSYLDAMPWWIDIDDDTKVVHAGFIPGVPVDQQTGDRVCRVVYVDPVHPRMATPDGCVNQKPAGSVRWATRWRGCGVVYGHAVFSFERPTIDPSPLPGHPACYGIDTGCYAGGRLTGWVRTPTRDGARIEIAQVQARQCYQRRELSAL